MAILKEHSSEDEKHNLDSAIGPFYTVEKVSGELNIDIETIGEMVSSGHMLALPTADGLMVFPSRQFITNTNEETIVNPAVKSAMHFLMEHEEETIDLLLQVDGLEEMIWTIAGVLLQPDEHNTTLLNTLQQHIENPKHESWKKLLDLNGIASDILTARERQRLEGQSQN